MGANNGTVASRVAVGDTRGFKKRPKQPMQSKLERVRQNNPDKLERVSHLMRHRTMDAHTFEVAICVDDMIRAMENERLITRYTIESRDINPPKELYHLVHSRMYKAGVHQNVVDAVGCSMPELQAYIESKLHPGMNWSNRGMREGMRGWELDHITCLSSFDLSKEWRVAFHYTNMQPLWFLDNMSKGTRTV